MGATLESIRDKTYYEILNLERDATVDQVKDSYKEIAKLYHPDSNFYTEIIQDPLSAEEQQVFQFITLAYTTLTNTEKKQAYDKTLAPILKGWDDDAAEEEIERPRAKTQMTESAKPTAAEKVRPQKVPVVTKAHGSIDLGRFQNTIRTSHETFKKPSAPKPQGLPKSTAMLVGIFALSVGLCAGLAIVLFLS